MTRPAPRRTETDTTQWTDEELREFLRKAERDAGERITEWESNLIHNLCRRYRTATMTTNQRRSAVGIIVKYRRE